MSLKPSRIQLVAIFLGAAYGVFIRIIRSPPSFLHLSLGRSWDNGGSIMSL